MHNCVATEIHINTFFQLTAFISTHFNAYFYQPNVPQSELFDSKSPNLFNLYAVNKK